MKFFLFFIAPIFVLVSSFILTSQPDAFSVSLAKNSVKIDFKDQWECGSCGADNPYHNTRCSNCGKINW